MVHCIQQSRLPAPVLFICLYNDDAVPVRWWKPFSSKLANKFLYQTIFIPLVIFLMRYALLCVWKSWIIVRLVLSGAPCVHLCEPLRSRLLSAQRDYPPVLGLPGPVVRYQPAFVLTVLLVQSATTIIAVSNRLSFKVCTSKYFNMSLVVIISDKTRDVFVMTNTSNVRSIKVRMRNYH